MNKEESDYSNYSLLELFRVEVEAQVPTLVDGLLALERDPEASIPFETLMRAAHSIKGAARLVGVKSIEGLAHIIEDIYVAAQHKDILLDDQHIDTLLKSIDTIAMIAKLPEAEIDQWTTVNAAELECQQALLIGVLNQLPSEGAHCHEPANEDLATHRVDKDESVTSAALILSGSAENSDNKDRVLRVSADRLNRLMGLSGELLVDSRRLYPYASSLLQLKKKQVELMEILDSLRDSIANTGLGERIVSKIVNVQKKANECRSILSDRITEIENFDRRATNLTTRLHREVLSSRMRPFADGIQGFPRMVRDLARTMGKKVQLEINGLTTEVDRDVLEKIEAPLTHLIRNAVDHGIETVEERRRIGKPEQGIIKLSAGYNSGMLSIVVEDDGRAVDYEVLRTKVVEKGLATEDMAANLTHQELLDFLYLPKFSTREKVTEISGRGVGLDIVHGAVQEMRGMIHTYAVSKKGMKFVLQLPITLSVIPALLVEIAAESYAFPLVRVERVIKVPLNEIKMLEGHQYLTLDNESIGLISAAQIFGQNTYLTQKEISVLVVSDRLKRYGVVVDKLVSQRELAVQSLDPRLGKVKDISAAAVLEDGTPTLIIDVDDLVRTMDKMISGGTLMDVTDASETPAADSPKHILVVDDSITVREVERNLLETNGYKVSVAVDGMDGWNAIRHQKFDLVITDIDMPRLDGFELVNLVRNDSVLKNLPVMIVSYKDRPEDKKRGLELGADYYLTKGSFHDETLLDAVIDLIGEAHK